MPYEVRARPYSETSAACAAAVAFDDAPRVLTPTQFDDEEEEEEEEEDFCVAGSKHTSFSSPPDGTYTSSEPWKEPRRLNGKPRVSGKKV